MVDAGAAPQSRLEALRSRIVDGASRVITAELEPLCSKPRDTSAPSSAIASPSLGPSPAALSPALSPRVSFSLAAPLSTSWTARPTSAPSKRKSGGRLASPRKNENRLSFKVHDKGAADTSAASGEVAPASAPAEEHDEESELPRNDSLSILLADALARQEREAADQAAAAAKTQAEQTAASVAAASVIAALTVVSPVAASIPSRSSASDAAQSRLLAASSTLASRAPHPTELQIPEPASVQQLREAMEERDWQRSSRPKSRSSETPAESQTASSTPQQRSNLRPPSAAPSSLLSAGAAFISSFDTRRAEVRTVRKTLADFAREKQTSVGTAPIAAAVAHPYLPKHAPASSLSVSQSHAYVYGHRNAHASAAISTLSRSAQVEQHPGSLTARRHVGLGTAQARANSLLTQLGQFTQRKNREQNTFLL
eukprot:gnl/Spiro4/5249_TR2651_c0_g1_i1.p1 gnl/Spiro4/5249_TR2651_c0_g1~~gnl/Spiro4/5249_TR2651_c0_g1_i1.p1  ORF type:complete len:482 (+),score=85.09 gnl/Spiro4/5249_TR2651_c0_g1_i1:167-1447(+)